MGRYEVLRVIGKGAMGVVYEGRDPNLDRRVAIKTVKVENLSEEAAAEYEHRFRTEARSAARLQHPNIVSVYDSDRDGNVAFLVMEYIQGDDLKHHLDRGERYSLEQSLKIVRDLLSALDYAHKQGIVHRDIKPANLLIEPGGRVKLTDFGVARIQDSGEATRTQGSMVGTLKYMAPEQVQGQKIDSRADLFSAGVVLYQLLTDKRPFDGDNDFSIIHQIIGHNPPSPSSINGRLPPALDAVVARALAKEREQRFATARDFAVALQAAIRRAEDQTVVPPVNPNKRLEALSRPLTVPPPTVPGGTVPGSATIPGGMSTVTQELELVYWKDVKDASDPEELQGFLERFPAGIYADLARRRLRRLAGGEPTVPASATQPGAAAPAVAAFGPSVFQSSAFPNLEAGALPAPPPPPAAGSDPAFQPTQWVDEEYTRTETQPREAMPPQAPASPAPAPAPARAAAKPEPAPAAAAPARKKMPVAMLAGVAALVLAGVLALAIGRGKGPSPEAAAPAAPAVVAANTPAPAPVPSQDKGGEPAADAPSAAAPQPPAEVSPAPAQAAAAKVEKERAAGRKAAAASQPRPAGTRIAAAAPAAEPTPYPAAPPPAARAEPEPNRPPPPAVATAGNGPSYQAVEQCKDRMFLSKELCLAEHCEKPGARNHPLCVKRRDEARMREESKQLQSR
nr:serine/threonine-protein kinase [Ramlibacter monticola]